jgi:hypothetical protein
MARIGRILGGVIGGGIGFFAGGPAGAAKGAAIGAGLGFSQGHAMDEASRGRREANKIMDEQRAAQSRQEGLVRSEQERINRNLAESQAKRNAGIARSARSRIRGGLFGEDSSSGLPLQKTLG